MLFKAKILVLIVFTLPCFIAAQSRLLVYGNSFPMPNIKADYGIGFTMENLIEDEMLEEYVFQVVVSFEELRKKRKLSSMHEFLLIKTYVQKTLLDENAREYCLFNILKALEYHVVLVGLDRKIHCMLHFDSSDILLSNNVFNFFDNKLFVPAFWENAEEDPSYNQNIILKGGGGRYLRIDTCLYFKKGPLDTIKFPSFSFYALKRNVELSNEIFFDLAYKLKFPIDSHFHRSILRNFSIGDDMKSIRLALKFVQDEIEYDAIGGMENGWQLPLRTISSKKGNCSSKSLLFSTIVSICTRKHSYIVIFKGKKGEAEHALSAFSDEIISTNYSKLTFCEPTGINRPVGDITYDIKDIIEVVRIGRPKLSCGQ